MHLGAKYLKVYIGETNCTAKQCVKEHQCHRGMGHPELSAVAEHAHSTGHKLFWEPCVIAREPQDTKRRVTEAIGINKLGKEKIMSQGCGLDIIKLWLQLVEPCSG